MNKIIISLLIILLSILLITGCQSKEKKEITNNAIEYFSNKYNINKKDIKITTNYLYSDGKKCFVACGDNRLYIKYKNKEYYINYFPKENYYADNYQYEEINKDLQTYLEQRFPYADYIEITSLEYMLSQEPDKYNGDIVKYLQGLNIELGETVVWPMIWLKAETPEEARTLKQKYSSDLVNGLENIKVNYTIDISNKEGFQEYYSYYYFHVYDNNFIFTDQVDGHNHRCSRTSLSQKCYE